MISRRDILKSALSASIGLAVCKSTSAAPLLDEVRFRDGFRRALRRLRLRGDISSQEHAKYWAAVTSIKTFEHEGHTGRLSEHLERSCQKIAQESGAFAADLSDWWTQIVAWIVDNWEVILKVLLSLLVFLDA